MLLVYLPAISQLFVLFVSDGKRRATSFHEKADLGQAGFVPRVGNDMPRDGPNGSREARSPIRVQVRPI